MGVKSEFQFYFDDTLVEEGVDSSSLNRFMDAKVGSENRLFGLSQNNTMVGIRAEELQNLVSGFVPRKRTMLSVCYSERATSYHLYNGGEMWTPTIPDIMGESGQSLRIIVKVLTVPDFVSNLPRIRFVNDMGASWVAHISELTGYDLKGDHLIIHFAQEPTVDRKSEFDVMGMVANSVGWGSVSSSYLDVRISDVFHTERILRIYFDGHNHPSIGIRTGRKFGKVHIVSYDGVRLAIGYERAVGDFRVAYLYTASPSTLYSLDEIHGWPLDYAVEGFAESWKINHVVPQRDLEQTIAFKGQSNNDIGRIGAEIAYCVATEKFGLPNVVMQDPSQPGPDLYTGDGRVLIEARLLQRTQNEKGDELNEDVTRQLNQMVRKLNQDFAARSSAALGYAIFSFIDNDRAIRTLVLRLCNTRKCSPRLARHERLSEGCAVAGI